MAVINVPKTPKRAYHPDRRPSGLIQAQIEHLEAAVAGDAQPKTMTRQLPPRTEGEAADYIAELTARLHPLPGAVPVPPDPLLVDVPTAPVAAARSRARHGTAGGGSVEPRLKAAAPRRSRTKPMVPSVASRKRGGRA